MEKFIHGVKTMKGILDIYINYIMIHNIKKIYIYRQLGHNDILTRINPV